MGLKSEWQELVKAYDLMIFPTAQLPDPTAEQNYTSIDHLN